MHKIQVGDVTAIENMKIDEKVNKVLDTILLNLRAKLIRQPIFG